MRKLLVCAALIWLAVSNAFGQEIEAAGNAVRDEPPAFGRLDDVRGEAARLLKSQASRERAWGAYLVGLHGFKEQESSLVGLLADPNLGNVWEEALVRQAALDSLIQINAEVPAEQLMPLYHSSPDEVLILLARTPERNQATLLPLLVEEMATPRWLAVGNLLAETRAPGFAARLLRDLKIEARVFVFDHEGPHNFGMGGGGGCGCGGDAPFAPEGFPPVLYYTLVDEAARGAVVVAPGRHPVFYLRAPARGNCCGRHVSESDRDFLRVDYLADLLNTGVGDLKFDVRPFHEVVCKDARQCRRALAALRREIGQSYADLSERLLKESLLDPAEASELKPDITFDLMDFRDDKALPLPDKLKGVSISIR
jgi:hypothetical protein